MRTPSRLMLPVLGFSAMCNAYEVDTHALITLQAFDRSVLQTSPPTLERLGLQRYDPLSPLRPPPAIPDLRYNGNLYFDLTPTQWSETGQVGFLDRFIQIYDSDQMAGAYRTPGANATARAAELRAWLMRGAIREDDLPSEFYEVESSAPDGDPFGEKLRVYHHFYDPIGDRALTPPAVEECPILPYSIGACRKSTDWAMGVTNAASLTPSTPDPNRQKHFTWADAREAMWCGLTYRRSQVSPARDAASRRLCWATAFKSLGHVLHLLQDAAQPQHTRNDRHNPTQENRPVFNYFVATDMARREFEIYTNYRATVGEVSAPGFEIDQFLLLFGDAASAPPIALGAYPTPRFATPVDFFTTRHRESDPLLRRGLADFSNRNFYTDGSLFSDTYEFPPASPSDPGLEVAQTSNTVPNFGIYTEELYLWTRSDAVAPAFVDAALASFGGKVPVARRSMWDDFRFTQRDEDVTVIPLELYRAHADVLLPRAAAYSAGLIDLFFRGELEVSEPTAGAGLIGVLDHGIAHTTDANGYPRRTDDNAVFGFTSMALRVRNVTPTIVVSGTGQTVAQLASSGSLVAVARYHRNPCYSPDLRGERQLHYRDNVTNVPSGCTLDQLRTAYEEISVSAPIAITNQLDGGAPTEFTFDFAGDPVPVNATDLFVQVVYRGRLGEEPDAIAVGRRDLPEPAYAVIINGSDYYWNGASWQPSVPGSPDAVRRPYPANLFDWRRSNVFYAYNTGDLPPGRFVRLALIPPTTPATWLNRIRLTGFSTLPSALPDYVVPLQRQAPAEVVAAGAYLPTPAFEVRGAVWDGFLYLNATLSAGGSPSFTAYAQLPPFLSALGYPGVTSLGTPPALSRQ